MGGSEVRWGAVGFGGRQWGTLTQVLLLLLAREGGGQHGGQPRDERLVVLRAHPASATPPGAPLGRRLAGRACASDGTEIYYTTYPRNFTRASSVPVRIRE